MGVAQEEAGKRIDAGGVKVEVHVAGAQTPGGLVIGAAHPVESYGDPSSYRKPSDTDPVLRPRNAA